MFDADGGSAVPSQQVEAGGMELNASKYRPVCWTSTLPEYSSKVECCGSMIDRIRNNYALNICDEEIRTWWNATTGNRK